MGLELVSVIGYPHFDFDNFTMETKIKERLKYKL
jgi:hypothetical protein